MGIVHRDISPQNVLVSEQGEVKLTDFGIAKAFTKRDRTADRRGQGQDRIHVARAGAGQAIDARSDLFSLGTLLYLATTGQRPFEAATDFEVIARVQKGQFRPPEDVSPDMPASLAAIIRRALALDREQRYRTADELLVDLEGVWRSEYGAPGQTELKLWLAELGRADAVPPIGKISFATNARSSGTHNAGRATWKRGTGWNWGTTSMRIARRVSTWPPWGPSRPRTSGGPRPACARWPPGAGRPGAAARRA